ncbi:MAG TPA: hypothetical protein VFA02_05780, partial [Pseudacidobacterium sp.]|nr:hypothetical protein [Pseudacidobacterium sp.]
RKFVSFPKSVSCPEWGRKGGEFSVMASDLLTNYVRSSILKKQTSASHGKVAANPDQCPAAGAIHGCGRNLRGFQFHSGK